MMYTLGIDVGSSSVKVSLLDVDLGYAIAGTHYPKTEMLINAPQPGFAEQDPETWWQCFLKAYQELMKNTSINPKFIKAIGISYQMHGLVCLDQSLNVLRPAIIWCDSRAVPFGEKASESLGAQWCHQNLLNTPGNFTAAKLAWVKANQPELYDSIRWIMLPGDYLALKLTNHISTTHGGLSEGIFWNYHTNSIDDKLLSYFGFDATLIPKALPSFHDALVISPKIADLLDLDPDTKVCYRAGDQPNNAFSLNANKNGDMAATAGTSGVLYAVTDQLISDSGSRVNTFLHVANQVDEMLKGVLLCINGTGIANSWWKRATTENLDYQSINEMAKAIPIGSEGLCFYPFGNGAERVFQNQNIGAHMLNLDFNRHSQKHLYRAVQEGIVFSLRYGMEVMQELGFQPAHIKAGFANMFLSPVFQQAFVNTLGLPLSIFNTDGAEGAARGAAFGCGLYHSFDECFHGLRPMGEFTPHEDAQQQYETTYQQWLENLHKLVK